jgi:Transglutaminase-like superfamily
MATGGRLDAWTPRVASTPTGSDGEPQPGWRRPGGPTVEQTAEDLGHDPEKIFRFVADQIQYDPYVGVLRGATGTLWSRAGNSVDQAVLLAALLRESGVETRFAVGALDDETAAAVRKAAIVDEETLRERLTPVFGISREPTRDELALASEPEIEALIAELPERSEQLRDAAKEQLDDALTTITTALREAGLELPEPEAFDLPDRERTEHVWVQSLVDGHWVDLDATLPGAEARATLADAAATMPELADEWRHTVTVTVAAEFVADGALSRRDLISLEAFSENLVGHPITIAHAKPEGLLEIGANLAGLLDGTVQYVPMIVVGDSAHGADDRITFATEAGFGSVIEDLDISLSGAVDTSPPSADLTEGETLAAWVEVTVTSPDASPRTVEREIFDRIGFVRRARGDVDLDSVEPVDLVDVEDARDEYLPLRAVWSLAVSGASVPVAYFDQDTTVHDYLADLDLMSQGHTLVRDALQLEVGRISGHRYHTAAPTVTAYVAGPTSVTATGSATATAWLDLLARGAVAVPLADAIPGAAHPAIVAGVLSHVAERIARGDWSGRPARRGNAISVGRLFEQVNRDAVAIHVVRSRGDVDGLMMSDEAMLRILDAVDRGLVVVAPERAVVLGGHTIAGWWLVDPVTGWVADELECGRGIDWTEYLLQIRVSLAQWGPPLAAAACFLGRYAQLLAAIVKLLGFTPSCEDAGSLVCFPGDLLQTLEITEELLNATDEHLSDELSSFCR